MAQNIPPVVRGVEPWHGIKPSKLTCDCLGYAWKGDCKHVAAVETQERVMHLVAHNFGSMLLEVE